MKEISRLIESIEADVADELDFELECKDLVAAAADKNFRRFKKELKTNSLAYHFAEALGTSAGGSYDGYIPEVIADSLPSRDFRLAERVYYFLLYTNFADSKEELFAKARKAAGALQQIGDKYFPGKHLMNITGGDEEFVWTECFPEFWQYLLSKVFPKEKIKIM